MLKKLRDTLAFVTAGSVLRILLGCMILTFGVYNIHSLSGVTEGGVLGLMLLLDNLFGLSPAWTSLILNGYAIFSAGGRSEKNFS